MKILLYGFLALLTAYNVYLSSFSVRAGEVNFFNDVARDFLLLDELDEKKIVLIGPRSNTAGLFHGPLWTYINYPAYVLGNGNPIVVAWFWIFLEVIFLLTSFFMVRKLFNTLSAFAFIILASIRLVLHMSGIFHSEATFFIIPFFFFSIAMYIQSKKILYLCLHMLALAILMQLNIGLGMQFLILSTLLILYVIIKNKAWKHVAIFSLLPLLLFNFILFDIRHEFRMLKAILSTGEASQFFIPLASWLENRFNNIVSLELLEQNSGNNALSFIIFGLVLIFTIAQIKNKSKYRSYYFLFFFYYFGYMALSFFNKGILLYHYVHLLIPLTTLWLVSFLATKYKMVFLPFIIVFFIFNFNYVKGQIGGSVGQIGNHINSWRSLSNVAQEIIANEHGEEFGYFVYAPDAYAYQPRYAMLYNFKAAHAKAFEYVKKSTTYVIAAPPPPNNLYMQHEWWITNEAKIQASPSAVKKLNGGFTVEKFNLTQEEQKVPYDPNIELGIHFR